MKTKEKTQKLIDILRNAKDSNEETALVAQSAQASINTQQEILNLQGQINQQNAVISLAIQAPSFSAAKVYAARRDMELLEVKLAGIQGIFAELF